MGIQRICAIGGNLPRQTLIYGIVILAVILVVGGYVGYTVINSNQSPASPSPSPSATTTPSQTPQASPTASPEVSPSPEASMQEQARDAAMTLMSTNYPETAQLTANLSWTGGRQDTGLVGAEKYLYTSSGWNVLIEYPVIPNPTYTVTANYTAGEVTVEWQGTYQNGTATEISCVSYNLTVRSTEEMARDDVLDYIASNHNQTRQYMQITSWSGQRTTPAMILGSESYRFQTNGWTITMQHPVVPNPIYNVNATYVSPVSQITPEQMIIDWQGTWQSGTVTETKYTFNP